MHLLALSTSSQQSRNLSSFEKSYLAQAKSKKVCSGLVVWAVNTAVKSYMCRMVSLHLYSCYVLEHENAPHLRPCVDWELGPSLDACGNQECKKPCAKAQGCGYVGHSECQNKTSREVDKYT